MKKFLITIALLTPPLLAIAGISITLGEPDYYGQIQLGHSRPQLVYANPVVIFPSGIRYEPLYLRVPPRHYQHWKEYCYQYNACNRPVYFVRDDWYRNDFAPRYHEDHGRGHAYGRKYHRHHDWDDQDNWGNRSYPPQRNNRNNVDQRGFPGKNEIHIQLDNRGFPVQRDNRNNWHR